MVAIVRPEPEGSGSNVKRQKTSWKKHTIAKPAKTPSASRIFSPFRTLGLVSPTTVPFTSIPLGKTTFQITTSVGRSLQTYDLRKGLSLVFLTRPQTPGLITATFAWKDRVFAAWGAAAAGEASGIWVFKRGKKVGELPLPQGFHERIDNILIFGSWIVAVCAQSIQVWRSTNLEHYATLTPPASGIATGDRRIMTGKICNMPTYLNKVFVGRTDGGVDIWNLSTARLLYTILPAAPNSGAVTALQPSMALSLMAIAYSSGALVIHDIKFDRPILTLRSPTTNSLPVTTISFRSDGLGAGEDGREDGVMATAGPTSGDITMWDLNEGGRISGILRDAHEFSEGRKAGGVTKTEFLPGQPVIVSTGTDNALRTWIIDEAPFSPIPRPLHFRRGHAAGITTLSFLPANSDGSDTVGKWLLSASKDRSLWGFSLRKDSQNTELSQGNVKRKAKKIAYFANGSSGGVKGGVQGQEELKVPEVTCIASSLNRDGGMGTASGGPIWANKQFHNAEAINATGWESVVTGHKGDKVARTWLWGKKKAGRWAFPTSDKTEVMSVAMSPCGTFALIGSAGGCIDMFNLQSGIHRQSFPARLTAAQVKKLRVQELIDEEQGIKRILPGRGKHTSTVTGLMVDPLNRFIVSCGLDGKIKFWDFVAGRLLEELDWHHMCGITGLRYNHSSELIAFSCDDLAVRLIDIETKKLVREFRGCGGRINDLCFSQDGRWIIAASSDHVIRVWDLPTGHLIDAFRTRSPCTSLALSSTGEFLATAHEEGVGINVWNNRSLFMHVPTAHIDENAIADVEDPTASGEGGVNTVAAAFEEDKEELSSAQAPAFSAEQLSNDLMTLSLMPKGRWQTLLNIDVIKERNKPKEPPKAPAKAPFFLSSGALQSSADAEPKVDERERSRVAKLQSIDGDLQTSQFTALLRSGRASGDFSVFIDHLKSLAPARADLEIRSLDPVMREDRNEFVDFVAALTQRLRTKRDFELVNTWMAVFLRVHGDIVANVTTELAEDEDEDGQGARHLHERLVDYKSEQIREGKRLADMVGYCRGIVGFLRSGR